MSRAWVIPARAFSVLVSMVMLMFTLGIALPASADPPEDTSNQGSAAAGNSAEAHEKNADRKSESSSSTTKAATTGGDATASSKGSSKAKSTKTGRGSGRSKATSHAVAGTSGTSGDVKQPQPESTADQNSGGANAGDCPGEPYCSTRDGSPSLNGNGGGKAAGKPCAGCVGKADNKNPPGQVKEWNAANGKIRGFGNKGYECDDNNGIGKTNPAHTGCTENSGGGDELCPDGSPLPASGDIADCDSSSGGDELCPDGSPLPASGDIADCDSSSGGDELCPDGSPLPASGDIADCDKGGGNPPPGPEGNPPPGTDENPPTVIAGVQDFANPRPPTVAGVEAFAAPPAVAPQAGVLPSTGATAMTGALTTAGFALLLMGGAVIGLRRQSLARAKR